MALFCRPFQHLCCVFIWISRAAAAAHMLHCGTSTLPALSFIPAGPTFERVQWDIFEIYLKYIWDIFLGGKSSCYRESLSEEKDVLEADRQFVASSGQSMFMVLVEMVVIILARCGDGVRNRIYWHFLKTVQPSLQSAGAKICWKECNSKTSVLQVWLIKIFDSYTGCFF